MSARFGLWIVVVLVLGFAPGGRAAALPAPAEPGRVKFAELLPLLQSLRVTAAAQAAAAAGRAPLVPERPVLHRTPGGHVESLSAGPGLEFPVAGPPGRAPEETARAFLREHARALGVAGPSVDFTVRRKNSAAAGGRHSVRFTQSCAGVPVFGGEIVVQVNEAGGVEFVAGNLERATDDLDTGRFPVRPRLTAAAAEAVARARYAAAAAGQDIVTTPPQTVLFVPSLLKLNGPRRLAWQLDVWTADRRALGRRVFIDANTGEFVQDIALIHEVLSRRIHDGAGTINLPGTLIRVEGQGPTGLADADFAYDFLGDTHRFYQQRFGRDGVANDGAPLIATVRHCQPDECPMANAYWDGTGMRFGLGYATDDVVGHELTHGVTANESGLIYLNESGAINESLSDIFGEFVDLTNTGGDDSSGRRWLIGEDLPRGTLRSMKDPTSRGSPDWLGSSLYHPPSNTNDHGGVHSNSGVNNKLCYLLTDGGTHRDIPVSGQGLEAVAALYYEANVNLLVSSSGWDHLGAAVRRAAVNLGWSETQRTNLERALAAVGIGSPLDVYFVDEDASGACFHTGDSFCSFLFDNGPYDDLSTALSEHDSPKVLMLRATARENRLSGRARILPWDDTARIEPE